jgi:dethiobiotin synthetase
VSVLFVTGTDTGVGKTIATAALACSARLAGLDVAICKPAQTGTADGDDDLVEIRRLSGVSRLTGAVRYPQPLGPVAAAELAGMPLWDADELLAAIRAADAPGRLTLVEGAGGLLVALGAHGVTLRDLAQRLDAPILVVVRSGLGTLNHTALTLEAIAAKELLCAGLVVGSWPADPGPADVTNRAELARMAAVRAVLPAGAGTRSADEFEALARESFDPHWVAGLVS